MSEANIFIIINLGCEMLYVIEQRLQAQRVTQDKSSQVMRDISSVLLDPKFVDRLILGSQQKSLITPEHCKFILNDIACCSLMRLDEPSMGKLWDLMTMIFKWQLFVSKRPQHLLDITFRHLDGIGQLYPEVKKSILVDYTKNNILDFWNSKEEIEQQDIFRTIKSWFDPIAVKISILIRLGFQLLDGSFIINSDEEYFKDFADSCGENIYNKSAELTNKKDEQSLVPNTGQFEIFANQLNVTNTEECKNIVLDDFLVDVENIQQPSSQTEFVQIKTARSTSSSWESVIGQKNCSSGGGGRDLKSLLNTKLT